MHVAAVKLPVQGARAAVDQCLKIGVIIERACDTLLFKLRFQSRGKMVADKMRAQAQPAAQVLPGGILINLGEVTQPFGRHGLPGQIKHQEHLATALWTGKHRWWFNHCHHPVSSS